MSRLGLLTLVAALGLFHTAGGALASESDPSEVVADADKAGMPPPPYQSPRLRREECETELKKDAIWRTDLRDRLRQEVRVEDADEFLRNKRHVVIAYAAIWILSVGFLFILWRRQRGFAAEIALLRDELERAMSEAKER